MTIFTRKRNVENMELPQLRAELNAASFAKDHAEDPIEILRLTARINHIRLWIDKREGRI